MFRTRGDADANGVVTIPAEIASHVIEEAARIHDRESAQMAWVNSVEFSLDALRRRG